MRDTERVLDFFPERLLGRSEPTIGIEMNPVGIVLTLEAGGKILFVAPTGIHFTIGLGATVGIEYHARISGAHFEPHAA